MEKDYKVVAVVLAGFSQDYQKNVIKSIRKKSEEYHCKPIFFSTLSSFYLEEQEDTGEKDIFDYICVERFDAIVLMAETFKDEVGQAELVKRAKRAGVSVIAVDHETEGCFNISFDYEDAFLNVVKHMVEFHGYRDIVFMAGAPNNRFSDDRLRIFRQVLEANGGFFQPENVYYGYFWEDPTVVAIEKMLAERKELPEAIICANDTMALTVCAQLQDRGFRVPEDVAVSGFDGIEAEQYQQPRLLTGVYDADVFAEALFDAINQPDEDSAKSVCVPAYSKLQVGGSCGCRQMENLHAAAKIVELKSASFELMEYQMNLGRMVANYGTGASIDIINLAIPQYLKDMRYCDFWFCSGSDVLVGDYRMQVKREKLRIDCNKKKKAHVLHYKKFSKGTQIDYRDEFYAEDLIPELSEVLESEQAILVVSVPNQNAEDSGMAIVSFDVDKFWYTAYASFIFHFRFLIEMQRTQNQLFEMYHRDSLTGLYSRNGFYAKMEQLLANVTEKELTVISLDMYRFKQINDTYGHAEGDEALKAVGRIIQETVSNEIAARIGGDEFLIVLFGENQRERTNYIIHTLKEKAEVFNRENPKAYRLIFSIGCCTESVEEHTLDYFLREADRRMYEHKREQKIRDL